MIIDVITCTIFWVEIHKKKKNISALERMDYDVKLIEKNTPPFKF